MPQSARGLSEDSGGSGRGAVWIRATVLRAPEQIMQEMARALKLVRVGFKQLSPALMRCELKGLRFEMQVSHLDQVDSPYMIKIQRTSGEFSAYRELCAKVLAEMQL